MAIYICITKKLYYEEEVLGVNELDYVQRISKACSRGLLP
jgi:hypothetical protein